MKEGSNMEKITFEQLKEKRLEWKSAVIVFTEDSFDKVYPLEARSYRLTDNEMWGLDDTKMGRRITGSSLDGTDNNVRLDCYMNGYDDPADNWKIDYCYIEEFIKGDIQNER
jgi:hypothetical protein